MMDLGSVPPWLPEDDLLLKNAVEAGASLESLAKGAVSFSRKYSLTELRDRWHSLLYDPVVSAEASAKMVSLELSGSFAAASLKAGGSGSKEVSGEGVAASKRKIDSVRRHYNATKKSFRRQVFFDTFDRALQAEMNIENNVVTNDECLGKNVGVELGEIDNGVSLVESKFNKDMNNLIGYGNYSGLEEVGPSHSISDVPLWKTIEDIVVPAMPVQVSVENKNHSTEERVTLPHGLNASEVLKASAARLGEGVEHLSDSLLNLTSEDELIVMDIDVKDATDKPCYDNVDSLLLSSPFEIQGNDASDIREPQKDTETKGSSVAGLEVVANPLGFNHGDLHSISNPGNGAQSSIAVQSPHPELSEKFVICLFNTEDPDVPSNDGTDFSVVVPLKGTMKSQPIVKEVGCSDSSINNQRKNELVRSSEKEDIPSHSFPALQIVRPGLVPNINSSHLPVGVVVKPENPRRSSISAVSGQSTNFNINPSQSRLVHATMMPALDGRPTQKEIDALDSAKVYLHQKEGEHESLPKSEAKPLSLDLEGDDDDDDNDIPSFSDVETMILEMDLCPRDQDTSANREVSTYHHEETKRTIMRLEQAAESFMHRAITSRGALAVLYGHKLKEYIKKIKVILGRATDEVKVDIDLGREGCANKISRRQALIKMEANGSFIIKNLGKKSIFLNGKEIATGQMRLLSASCLIQIRDMSFIFQINDKSVRKFLENVDKDRSIKRRQTLVA